MVTVGVSARATGCRSATPLIGWLNTDEAIVPKETIYPPGPTEQQSDQQNTGK